MYVLTDMEKKEIARIKAQAINPIDTLQELISFARGLKGTVTSACPFCERKEAVLKEANI